MNPADIVPAAKRAVKEGIFSLAQFATLALLAHGEDECLSRLAGATGITAGAFTGTADALEAKGFVVSSRAFEDRRKRMLRITDKGLAVFTGKEEAP